jgi:DNA repair exonuclease SbcCD ATPase subunit
MRKPVPKDKCEVEVYFQINDSIYSVKRVVERNKGTTYAEIKKDGKILESPSPTKVTELVQKILKTDYELFSKAIYSEQNALDYFLTIPKGKRMKKIDELLMLDRFEKVRENTVTLINKISNQRTGLLNAINNVDTDSLKESINKIENDIKQFVEERKTLESELERILSQKNDLEKEISEIKKIKENLEVMIREEKASIARIDEIKNTLSSIEDLIKDKKREDVERELEKISDQIKSFDNFLKEKQAAYQNIQEETINSKVEIELLEKEKITKLEKDFEEKSRIKRELEKYKEIISKGVDEALMEKKKILEKINEDFQMLKVKILFEQETLEYLDSAEGKCPICESTLSEKRKKFLIRQKKNRIKTLSKSLEQLAKDKKLNEEEVRKLEEDVIQLTKMLSRVEDYEEIKNELEKVRKTLAIKKEDYVKLERELSKVKKEVEELQEKLKESSNKKQELEDVLLKMVDYENYKKRLEEIIKRREDLSKHIKEIENSLRERQIEEKEKWLKNLIAKEKEIEGSIYRIDQLSKEKQIRLAELKNNLENVLKSKMEASKLENIEKNLKIFRLALEKTQENLRKHFIVSVNAYMNKIWQDIYPHPDLVGVRLSIEGGDYVLQLQERAGNWVNVEGRASGGERTLAALALRIAFALVLAPHLRVMFLDEPSHNLDSNAISELAITLRDRIGNFLDQVILITHEEGLMNSVTGRCYKLERDKARDGPTKVIQLQ